MHAYTNTLIMKFLFTSFLLLLVSSGFAQLSVSDKCGTITVDVLDGKINGMRPNRAHEEFVEKFPCATSISSAKDSAACGTALYFKDKDFVIYTDRDYVEIGPGFKGRMITPLLGARKGSLFNQLGNPKLKDGNWEAYQTNYGILVLYYSTSQTVNKIQFSTHSAETLRICSGK